MFIPLKVDVYLSRRPLVNYGLIVLIVLISIVGFSDSEFFCRLAGIGVAFDEETFEFSYELTTEEYPRPILAITSSLLHGGWLHLLGNMLFLWVFGNAVNYKLGNLFYPWMYLAAAMGGGMAHYVFQGGPVVGASGAINGVMGAFLVFFPRNDVKVFMAFHVLVWRVHSISSIWVILLWLACDVLWLVVGAGGVVALWAHVGGFVTGFGMALILAATGLIKPTQDEQTLIQVLRSS